MNDLYLHYTAFDAMVLAIRVKGKVRSAFSNIETDSKGMLAKVQQRVK